jgi:uncharacterized protein (UPF0332 family)
MTERQQGFLQMAEASIRAAEHLLEQGDYPGFVVSRSYYAMFYGVSALLEGIGQRFSSHGQAIGAFGREFIKTEKLPTRLHAALKEAFDLRSSGDYDPSGDVTVEDARESIANAHDFINTVRTYLNSL